MCYVLRDRKYQRKLDAMSDEWIFLGYSRTSKAYCVYNKHTKVIMEFINVVVKDLECSEEESMSPEVLTVVPIIAYPSPTEVPTENTVEVEEISDRNNLIESDEDNHLLFTTRRGSKRVQNDHPLADMIGDGTKGVQTRGRILTLDN